MRLRAHKAKKDSNILLDACWLYEPADTGVCVWILSECGGQAYASVTECGCLVVSVVTVHFL